MNLSLLAAIALAQAAALPPTISHQATGEGRYRLRIELTGVSEVEPAQRMLLPEARRLCGERPPIFGRYRWEALERMERPGAPRAAESIVLEQEIACGAEAAPPEPAETAARVGQGWQPTPAAEQSVRAATSAYFAARDQGRYAEAWAMLSAGNQAEMPRERWAAGARDFAEVTGAPRGLRLVRVTWYVNPPSAPVPGVYAAVDYSAEYANLHFMCGYLVWLLQEDGGWRLVREEQSLVGRADTADATPEDLARLRAQFCRD